MAGNGNGEGDGNIFTGNNYRSSLTTFYVSTYNISATKVYYSGIIRCIGIIVGW